LGDWVRGRFKSKINIRHSTIVNQTEISNRVVHTMD
jgi:hypothetical protein